jgi:hypothetical protein
MPRTVSCAAACSHGTSGFPMTFSIFTKSDFLKSRKNAPNQSIELLVNASDKVTEPPENLIYFEKPTHLKNSKNGEIGGF